MNYKKLLIMFTLVVVIVFSLVYFKTTQVSALTVPACPESFSQTSSDPICLSSSSPYYSSCLCGYFIYIGNGGEGTPPSPSVDLSTNRSSVVAGNAAILKWSSINASRCDGTGFSTGGSVSNTTGVTVYPSTVGTNSYSITCSNFSDTAFDEVNITAVAPAPTVTLTANGSTSTTIVAKQSTDPATSSNTASLSWVGTDSTSCSGVSSKISSTPTTLSDIVPFSNSTPGTYPLFETCYGASGTTPDTATVSVIVTQPPGTCSNPMVAYNCATGTSINNSLSYSGLNSNYTWNCNTAGGSSPQCSETKVMSGSLSCSSCVIASGASSCSSSLSWSVTNPQSTSAVTSSYPSTNTTVATGNSGSATVTIPYSSRNFYLYNNSVELDSCSSSSSCTAGTSWDGSKCAPPPVDGVCSAPGLPATHYSCYKGISVNNVNGATAYTWTCGGLNGGTSVSCTENKPVNCVGSWGACVNGSQTYTVTTPAAYGGTACSFTNGATQSCSLDAVCSATHNNCTIGTSTNPTSDSTNWYWTCTGLNGGASSSCSQARPVMSGSLSLSSCSIPLNSSSCNITISWSTTNPQSTSAVTSSYPSADTTVATGNSGSKVVSIPYLSRNFYLYNNGIELDSGIAYSSCASGSWNGSVCAPTAVNGVCSSSHYNCSAGTSTNNVNNVNTWDWDCYGINGGDDASCSESKDSGSLMSGTLSSPSCTITAGNSSCNATVSWNTTNAVGTSAVTSTYPSAGTTVATGNSGSQSITIPFDSRDLYLYNSAQLLASSSASASCVSGTNWNYSTEVCETIPPPTPTTTITATPSSIAKGDSSTITWSSNNATSCVGTNFDTGNATSGSVVVSPTVTTSYSMVCTGAGGQAGDQATVTVTVTGKKPIFKEN